MSASGDENIGGLDVAVDDAFEMGRFESIGDFNTDVQKLVERQRLPIQMLLEALAVESFHDDKGQRSSVVDVIDRTNVGVIEGRSSTRLAGRAFRPRLRKRRPFRRRRAGSRCGSGKRLFL